MVKHNNVVPRPGRTVALLVLYASLAAPFSRAAQAIFQVIYNNQMYPAPFGLTEGSPGVFYSTAGTAAPVIYFSVGLDGKRTILGSLPTGSFFQGTPISGPNARFYMSAYNSTSRTGGLFSVAFKPGGQRYTSGSAACALSQNLPDGAFLGTGVSGASGYVGFVRCDTDGTVSLIAQAPPANFMPYATYATDGNYYGFTLTDPGVGSVVQATPSGTATTLYSFAPSNFTRGAVPAPLLMAEDGNLYGSIATGGANGTGMIYKLTPSGQFTLLHSFEKGKYVTGPTTLIEASDGNIYGDTQGNEGSQIFRITKSGQYTPLSGLGSLGCNCWLLQGSDGVIYGMASTGGAYGYGGVFALDAGLPKPAPQALKFGPGRGPVGTRVRIWGYNLLQASVLFGGVPATTVSNSGPNYVWATVPVGATSGPITVTTPGGTSATQASFTVN